jgi:Flp pilus assembly protein TadD
MHRVFFAKCISVAFVVLAISCQVNGQRQGRTDGQPMAGQITGQVRLEGGGPAFDVLVSCDAFSGGFVGQEKTDRNGRFRFGNLGPSQFTITIRHPGYVPIQQNVELMTTSSAYVQLQLKRDPNAVGNPRTETGVISAKIPIGAQKEFDKGEAALASGKKEGIEEAIRHYQQAVTIYPQYVQAQLKLGTAYMDLGQWDKAEVVLRKTLEIDPKAVNALFALGELYLRQKKNQEAEKVLLQGLALEDRSYQGHLALARVYWDTALKVKDETQSRPSLEKSYEEVKKALELNPNLAEAHLLKGNLLFRVRRAPDALHEFEEYLRLEPKGQFAAATRAMVDKIRKALESTKRN